MPELSIIIPTYKREKRLCETIDAILGLINPGCELIIVDQTPDHLPDTEAFLSRLPGAIRVVRVDTPNLPAARNRGTKDD